MTIDRAPRRHLSGDARTLPLLPTSEQARDFLAEHLGLAAPPGARGA